MGSAKGLQEDGGENQDFMYLYNFCNGSKGDARSLTHESGSGILLLLDNFQDFSLDKLKLDYWFICSTMGTVTLRLI